MAVVNKPVQLNWPKTLSCILYRVLHLYSVLYIWEITVVSFGGITRGKSMCSEVTSLCVVAGLAGESIWTDTDERIFPHSSHASASVVADVHLTVVTWNSRWGGWDRKRDREKETDTFCFYSPSSDTWRDMFVHLSRYLVVDAAKVNSPSHAWYSLLIWHSLLVITNRSAVCEEDSFSRAFTTEGEGRAPHSS